jgi:uncharacterized protein (DUF1015 family)
MAQVKPFCGWHYKPDKVSIERVIAPPYDVISISQQKVLYEKDPHNVIRLILGQATSEEIKQDARYQTARKHLDEWSKQGVLVCDNEPAYYLYEINYEHPFLGRRLSRLALFGLLRLERFGSGRVFPHEKTHASPKVDRGKLLRATHANFSPVFTVYEDSTSILDEIHARTKKAQPLFSFMDDQDIYHKLWLINQPGDVSQISNNFRDKSIFIADGHHRYETALRFSEEMAEVGGVNQDAAWNYVLSTLVRFTDPGLLILPIHRVVSKSVSFSKDKLLERLKQNFILHHVSRSALEKISEGSIQEGFGFAFNEDACFLAELKDKTNARIQMPNGKTQAWYEIDMNLISYLIFEPLLKMKNDELEKTVIYTPFTEEAFKLLKTGKAGISFFVRPTDTRLMKQVCESGELMPQKSTYFYPKFPSGLVMYRHENA